MSLDAALRLTEMLCGCALIQQSLEHLARPAPARALYGLRLVLALALVAGFQTTLASWGLLGIGVRLLRRFDGPYNGGSDRLGLLILLSLALCHVAPTPHWQEMALGYLGVQLLLSYAMAGWVKAVNRDWWNGRALADVFSLSIYPQSEALRALAARPALMTGAGRAVVLFELAFPLGLLSARLLAVMLALAAAFHLANALLFGLNRFLWIWLSAFPALWWLQGRLFGG